MLFLFVMIALSNGLCIILSRGINGRLAQSSNAFYASLVNHVIGFIFLSIIILLSPSTFVLDVANIPLIALCGGVIGAFFVVINSYVLPRLGVTLTTILAISGQVLSGVVTDIIRHGLPQNIYLQLSGIILILAAISLRYIKN